MIEIKKQLLYILNIISIHFNNFILFIDNIHFNNLR